MDNRTMGHRAPSALALLAVLIGGCATTGQVAGPAYVPGPAYHLIMAEIAASRGAQATAAEEYLKAAESSEDPEASRRATQFAFEYGFDAWALRAARRWAQQAPDEATAHMYLARLLTRRKEIAAAASESSRALGPIAERAETDYLLLGGELEREDDAESVTKVMSRLANEAPQSAAMRLALGTAALHSGDFDLALESAYAALAGATASEIASAANVLVGRVLYARGDHAAAIDWVSRLVEADPTLDLELEHARLLAADGRQDEAAAALDELEERYGPEPEIRRLRAMMSIDAGDTDAAVKQLRELLREEEFAVESAYHLAGLAERQERFDDAAELYRRIPEGSYLLPSQVALARIAERRGDVESALRQLSQFAGHYPQLAFTVHRYQANILERASRHAEALDLLTYDLAYRPDDVELLLSRGALHEKLDQLEPALADLEAAVERAPDNAIALNALGYTLANRTGQHKEGYHLIRRALEREPDNAAILDSYGWVRFRQGKLAEARSYLQLAYSRFPDAEVAAHLGEVLWRQGEQDAARRLWADALEKNPQSKPLRDTMARLLPRQEIPAS